MPRIGVCVGVGVGGAGVSVGVGTGVKVGVGVGTGVKVGVGVGVGGSGVSVGVGGTGVSVGVGGSGVKVGVGVGGAGVSVGVGGTGVSVGVGVFVGGRLCGTRGTTVGVGVSVGVGGLGTAVGGKDITCSGIGVEVDVAVGVGVSTGCVGEGEGVGVSVGSAFAGACVLAGGTTVGVAGGIRAISDIFVGVGVSAVTAISVGGSAPVVRDAVGVTKPGTHPKSMASIPPLPSMTRSTTMKISDQYACFRAGCRVGRGCGDMTGVVGASSGGCSGVTSRVTWAWIGGDTRPCKARASSAAVGKRSCCLIPSASTTASETWGETAGLMVRGGWSGSGTIETRAVANGGNCPVSK